MVAKPAPSKAVWGLTGVSHRCLPSPMSKGRPRITIRMDEQDIAHLRDASRVYGAADVSAFVREMLHAVLSADVNERLRYVHALAVKLGEQLTLPLSEAARTTRTARKPRKKRSTRERRE